MNIADIKYVLEILVILMFAIAAGMGVNIHFNNQEVEADGYSIYSYATWISGHVEYIKYSDGSQDVKIYSGLGHRFFDSILYQDLDGDNRIDKIIRNGPEWKYNKMDLLLLKKYDYGENREQFDEADDFLNNLRARYP